MQLRINYIILVFFVTIFSCSDNSDKDIYKVVINSKIKPLPPPPPIRGDSISSISNSVIDSLNNVPLKIAVNPFLLDFKSDYTKLFNNINDAKVDYFISTLKVRKEDINARRSLKFTVLEEEISDFTSKLKFYDGILFLSTIKYDDKKDMALVIIGYTNGRLSSSTYLYLLKKNKKTWEIIKRKRLSVS
ncbi:hypothetical protein [Xanthomarina sp. GH4-25]|uniref:hypothetical protein n=1 Tax=Xanthomarina sp. GH4-25 TaxID=3349335 RepID=UPI0038783C38